MKQILWFRRDLRVNDSALLHYGKGEVLPIFIFDKEILNKLFKDDKRVTFIYEAVENLKKELQKIGLDLNVYYDRPLDVIKKLKDEGFDELLITKDFDSYAKKRDEAISKIIKTKEYLDPFLLDPKDHLKKDGTPYKVFTPFYKSLSWLTSTTSLELYERNPNIKLAKYKFSRLISLEEMGFSRVELPKFFKQTPKNRLEELKLKLENYEVYRDLFFKDGTSNLGVDLRFGTLSVREIFNEAKKIDRFFAEVFIRQLFWREFFNYILFHYPKSEFENWNGLDIPWNQNEEHFQRWCEGETGVPIVDAAMIELNNSGTMHNRLRMIVASFLTKNLLIDWKKGESYFAKKLLDYDASSNIGSWQWVAGTGADAAPYFRVFNPYTQSKKFDKDAIFIKSLIPSLKDVDAKLIHEEGALVNNMFHSYINPIVDTKTSRQKVIETFKRAKNETA